MYVDTQSRLIASGTPLYLTMDNTTYTMTIRGCDTVSTTHHLYIFLNLHNILPYLTYTHEVNETTTHCIMITTSPPSTWSKSNQSRRRLMIRNTIHPPDLETMLIFSVESTQHQLSIITLATLILLSIQVLYHEQLS